VTPINGDVRFQSPIVEEHKGTVEVYRNEQWGSFCHDDFNYPEADVICKQLGYPGAGFIDFKP